LIARRVREEGVYSEIVPFEKAEQAFAEMRPKGVILSGGPASVLEQEAPFAPEQIYRAGVPVLGICYGEQAMAQQLGGKVEGGHHREFGRAEVEIVDDCALFEGVWRKGERYPVWMSHGDRVTRLPGEAQKVIALFRDSYNIPLVHVEAEELFLKNLAGVEDPELKRKTIGRLFIDVFEAEAKKLGGAEFLAQGTLYPDVIESVSFS